MKLQSGWKLWLAVTHLQQVTTDVLISAALYLSFWPWRWTLRHWWRLLKPPPSVDHSNPVNWSLASGNGFTPQPNMRIQLNTDPWLIINVHLYITGKVEYILLWNESNKNFVCILKNVPNSFNEFQSYPSCQPFLFLQFFEKVVSSYKRKKAKRSMCLINWALWLWPTSIQSLWAQEWWS
jgi:hypothetical protein